MAFASGAVGGHGGSGQAAGDLLFGATASGVVASVYNGAGDADLNFSGSGSGTLPYQLPTVPDEIIFVTAKARSITVRT
jgi:hypothetical protein